MRDVDVGRVQENEETSHRLMLKAMADLDEAHEKCRLWPDDEEAQEQRRVSRRRAQYWISMNRTDRERLKFVLVGVDMMEAKPDGDF